MRFARRSFLTSVFHQHDRSDESVELQSTIDPIASEIIEIFVPKLSHVDLRGRCRGRCADSSEFVRTESEFNVTFYDRSPRFVDAVFSFEKVKKRRFSDPTANFLSSTAYSFVNPDLANYAADAFVYSQLSDLNNRADLTTSYPSTTRMHPYARQSFYPMYNQREIHSPSRTRNDYS